MTWRQHKAKPGLFIVPYRVILTLKAPLHISAATLMEVQYDPKEDLNVEVGSNYFLLRLFYSGPDNQSVGAKDLSAAS